MKSFRELEEYFESEKHLSEILMSLWNDFYQQITEYSVGSVDVAGCLQNVVRRGTGISS